MKIIKYLLLFAVIMVATSSCVVRARGGVYVRGHYENGAGGTHWVSGHYAQ
jgi:hypothetical protein